MLVLTRKKSEMIQIGKDIFVKVIRTGRSTVKIGIEAPANVRVLRGELCQHESGSEKRDRDEELDLGLGDLIATCSDQFPHPHIA